MFELSSNVHLFYQMGIHTEFLHKKIGRVNSAALTMGITGIFISPSYLKKMGVTRLQKKLYIIIY